MVRHFVSSIATNNIYELGSLQTVVQLLLTMMFSIYCSKSRYLWKDSVILSNNASYWAKYKPLMRMNCAFTGFPGMEAKPGNGLRWLSGRASD